MTRFTSCLLAASTAAMFATGARMSPRERAMGRFMRDGVGHEPGSPAAEAAATAAAERIKASFEKAIGEVKEIAVKAQDEVAKLGTITPTGTDSITRLTRFR